MKCMERNKSSVYYATYAGKEPVVDEYGNTTGEFEVKYGRVMWISANVSAAKGETQTRQFGENEVYDKVILIDNLAAQMNEYSVLWLDSVPSIDATGAPATNEKGELITPYDYVVTKVARSLNHISIAVRKVDVQ